MKRELDEVDLKDILDFWIKAYKLPKGRELWKSEVYIDQVKGKVFIIRYIVNT